MTPESKIPRWTAWARALAGRHGRRHERLDQLSLQLARPRALARSVQQRWFFSSRVVQPRISLAIQPVLRAAFWRGQERVERTATTARTTRTERTHQERVREVERFAATERVFADRSTALLKVFERLREPERVLGGQPARVERVSEAPALARSLAARVRREEKPLPGGTPARVLRPAETAAAERAEERRTPAPPSQTAPWQAEARRADPPGWGSPAAVPGSFPVPAVPPINVEALTDQVMRQIDRRVGAWRERTGGF
jgi:hypothetical protein